MARYAAPPVIPNHLVGAIVTTLCCCMPFGIVSLVFAAQVNTKIAAGDLAGAQIASRNAKTWMIVALVMGILTGGGAALLTLIQ
ncbi:MAG TPA: CD225/dispanin family protein [Thermoanaerobaculia bacterium]|nr:CD225/dispanin family protein [Thermoanaerobaculia bacterium]